MDDIRPVVLWNFFSKPFAVAGREWKRHVRREVVTRIAGATLASDDAAGLAAHWGSLLDRTASALGGGVFVIELDHSALRFVPAEGRGDGFVGVDLLEARRAARGPALERASARGLRVDRDTVWIAGTALRLVDAATP